MEQLLETGEFVATHGIGGELKLMPWADAPECMLEYRRLWVGDTQYPVTRSRVQGPCVLVKLQGVDTVEDAARLIHKTVRIARDDIRLPAGTHLIADLVGLEVYADGEKLGVLREVLTLPGNDVYVVRGKYAYMIPVVREFVDEPDFAAGRINVRLLEGMRTDAN